MTTPTQTPTPAAVRRLAEQVRYYAREEKGRQFRALVAAAGYESRPGGWIYDTATPGGRSIARGITALAAIVADSWGREITAETIVERIRTAAYQADITAAVDDETLAYAADPDLWEHGQADERDVAARHRAMHEGLITSGRHAERGQVVRHVETGTYGVFDRIEGGAAYVWFAGGDPWNSDLVHPDDVAVATVPELERAHGYWDITCMHCARRAVLDRDGNLRPHARRDGFRPSICGGSGLAPHAHDRTGTIRAQLLDADLTPMSVAAMSAKQAEVFPVAVIRIPGEAEIVVDHDGETSNGDRLAEALTRAGYEPARYGHPYDNLVDDGSAILLHRRDPDADQVDQADDVARCRVCGCTEDEACPGGCVWARDDDQLAAGLDPMDGDLCTACLPAPAVLAGPNQVRS